MGLNDNRNDDGNDNNDDGDGDDDGEIIQSEMCGFYDRNRTNTSKRCHLSNIVPNKLLLF